MSRGSELAWVESAEFARLLTRSVNQTGYKVAQLEKLQLHLAIWPEHEAAARRAEVLSLEIEEGFQVIAKAFRDLSSRLACLPGFPGPHTLEGVTEKLGSWGNDHEKEQDSEGPECGQSVDDPA